MNQKGLRSGLCSTNEANVDNSLLKRLRRKRKYSEGVVRLGSAGTGCNVQLFPLATYSLYVRRRVESLDNKPSKSSQVIISVPDCPGNQSVFRIVEDFCYGLMDDKDISISNVVKLMITSNFLEIECLALRGLKFLENSVFTSFFNCLDVLATFNFSKSGRDVKEESLFQKCKMALVSHFVVDKLLSDPSNSSQITSTRRCNVECLMEVAFTLPPDMAECIYEYCRIQQFGLAYYLPGGEVDSSSYITGRSCYQIPLCTHFRGNHIGEDGLVARFYPVAGSRDHGVGWIKRLSRLVPEPRRSSLILHLAKSMHLEDDITVPVRTICRSRLNWSFLCALLIEATKLRTKTGKTAIVTNLDKEIVNLQKLVSWGLGNNAWWRLAQPSLQLGTEELEESERSALKLVRKFKFGTLLSIVTNFRDFSFDDRAIISVGKILDACLSEHLQEDTFTVQQALLIYKDFPNNARSSHVDIYYVFEDSLERGDFSHQEILDLTKLFDYGKISDEIVEKLFIKVQCASCDPRLQKRFLEMQRVTRSDKEKSEAELVKLRNELEVQNTDIMKVQKDKEKAGEELMKLRDELHTQTANMIEARHDKEKNEEELIKLRDQLHVQTADIKKLRDGFNLQCENLLKVTEDRELAERNLEEEKEKRSCQICFTQPRNALSLPCMHFLYCSDCLQKHHRRSKTCPTCRASTTGVLKCILVE